MIGRFPDRDIGAYLCRFGFVKKCGEIVVIGSAKELPKKLKDLHRPYIDDVKLKCKKCKGVMRRVEDVLDVWFDAGVSSWAPLGYPSNEKLFKRLWPADFVLEGPDQIRGWWNSSIITSVISFDRRPFDNILFHGFVLDAHGNKMAKSKGNIVSPEDVVKKIWKRCFKILLPEWSSLGRLFLQMGRYG